jgi:arylformamidase
MTTQQEQPLDYRNQAGVPDHANYFTHWTLDSVAVRIERECKLDVAYGDGWRQRCDIFPTKAAGAAAPVLIFIHGGWWYFLDKFDYSYLAPPFVDRGVVFVAITYPMTPHAKMGELVGSVRKAVLWVRRNIRSYGGDPDQIHIAGHSAGGHLTATTAFMDWTQDGEPSDIVKTCCSVSGLYDLMPIHAHAQNARIRMSQSDAETNSPIRHIRKTKSRIILSVGGDELSGFHWQHRTYASACERAGVRTLDASVPGKHHFNVIDELGNPESVLFKAVYGSITST